LAESAGYKIVGCIEQVREPDPRFQIGAGKVEKLSQLIKEKKSDRVIFDNFLKPVQAYNLAKNTGVEVIDRFQLILEIFGRRATTAEAKLQIRLARLRYELTHAKEKVRLARKAEQPGFMGLGAYEVDIYYKNVQRRIRSIRSKLDRIRNRRVLHRNRRTDLGFQSISLAGYTNAGKSSLFNALTEEEVEVNEALFTTLSTKTRMIKALGKEFMLTDTVGFIDRLPLTLIEAFHSTLEETIYSDLILLVLDASESINTIHEKLSCCLGTINQIGASAIPRITVLNKIDLISTAKINRIIKALKENVSNPVPISALHKHNLTFLSKEICRIMKDYVQASIIIPLNDEYMSFISWLHGRVNVKRLKYENNSAHIIFEARLMFIEEVRKRVVSEFAGTMQRIK
jgi:GTP-binding protein HflX